MRKITEIIIHCADTPESVWFTAADIDAWHKKNGWKGIGYHFVVLLDGCIQQGRPLESEGAHCLGHNKNSIGVCYIGGKGPNGEPKDTRTWPQRKALRQLLKMLKADYPEAAIFGHRDFAAKACPCFDAAREYKNI